MIWCVNIVVQLKVFCLFFFVFHSRSYCKEAYFPIGLFSVMYQTMDISFNSCQSIITHLHSNQSLKSSNASTKIASFINQDTCGTINIFKEQTIIYFPTMSTSQPVARAHTAIPVVELDLFTGCPLPLSVGLFLNQEQQH